MKTSKFYLIVQHVDCKYKYTVGFKSSIDADKYVESFGGVIEVVDCTFYKDFNEANEHKIMIDKTNNAFKDFIDMSYEEKILFKHRHPEIIEQLKSLF